jgi:hypothetical protein
LGATNSRCCSTIARRNPRSVSRKTCWAPRGALQTAAATLDLSNIAVYGDVSVTSTNPTGTALVYATYIGGSGDDRGAAIAVDSDGQAYVTGATASSNFPLAAAIRTGLGGSKTAFVLKLNAVGNMLLYSTYMGGSNWETGNAIAVDGAGNMFVAGDTLSANFPVLTPVQSTIGGGMDAFVTGLTSEGQLSFSTFLGGAGNEHAGGIARDGFGNTYVVGGTYSANFPVVAAIQGVNGGSQDAFVTKIDAAGNSILYSTYLGGSGSGTSEQANSVAVDSSGNAYVTGVTNSSNFPVTSGAYQTAFNGVQDAFVTKINATGNTLVYSTYLGGTGFDWASGIGLDSGGNAYVAGYTSSGDFATVNGVQFALAYGNELQRIPGFQVVPVGRVEYMMRTHGITLASPQEARLLAQLLEVDRADPGLLPQLAVAALHALRMLRGDDAGGNGQRQRDEEPGSGQLEGGGQPLEHEVHGRLSVPQRLSEIPADGALHEAQVLHGHRVVEAHRLAEAGDIIG